MQRRYSETSVDAAETDAFTGLTFLGLYDTAITEEMVGKTVGDILELHVQRLLQDISPTTQ